MNLLETLALLTFILALLSLVVDVIRLTVEVTGWKADLCSQRPFCL